jgi:hypothetical protein
LDAVESGQADCAIPLPAVTSSIKRQFLHQAAVLTIYLARTPKKKPFLTARPNRPTEAGSFSMMAIFIGK